MNENQVDNLAKKIWDYHHLYHKLEKADCILVLGSHDTRVAERGAQLYLDGYAPLLIFSGGFGRLTIGEFQRPEADIFADIALKMGVPADKIIQENKSTNTGENIIFTKRLLERKGMDPNKIILVQKPYMERRTYATIMKQWPGKKIIVTSPQIPYEQYFNDRYPKEKIISIIVGDLQRIKEYPQKGYQIPQEIPSDVRNAYEQLVEAGYTKHLIKE